MGEAHRREDSGGSKKPTEQKSYIERSTSRRPWS